MLRPLDLAMGLAPEVVLCQGKPRSYLDFNLDPTFEDTFFFFFFLRKWSTQRALWAWWVWNNRPAKRLCCFFRILNVIGNLAPKAFLDKEIFYSKTAMNLEMMKALRLKVIFVVCFMMVEFIARWWKLWFTSQQYASRVWWKSSHIFDQQ